MIDNYSLNDLFANIYKKLKLNIFVFVAVYLFISIPLIYKTINNNVTTKSSDGNFSSYIIYKINANEINNSDENKFGGYSDFYAKLIKSNINGAFLFNETDDNLLSNYSNELSIDKSSLKYSDNSFWDRKIIVNPVINNKGVSISILTPSKKLNLLIEDKIDSLMSKYGGVYNDVKVEKIDSVYSSHKGDIETIVTYNKQNLIIKLLIIFIMLILLQLGINFIAYFFNPTINRTGDYSRYYDVKKVFDIESDGEIEQLKNYFNCDLTYITTLDKIKLHLENHGYKVIKVNNFKDIQGSNNFIFIEEYGLTRYKKFEKSLQKIRNLDKNVLGVISYKL